MADSSLTAERLREVLDYDPETGVLTNRTDRRGGVKAGSVAGSRTRTGYLAVSVGGKGYLVHRLVWLYSMGVWPSARIDHINGNRSDNRLANLRDVSHAMNVQNQRGTNRVRASGFMGVVPEKRRKAKWRAQITVDGTTRCLGRFESAELAHECYLAAKRLLHAGCTI